VRQEATLPISGCSVGSFSLDSSSEAKAEYELQRVCFLYQ
jgi:hypothetical protein